MKEKELKRVEKEKERKRKLEEETIKRNLREIEEMMERYANSMTKIRKLSDADIETFTSAEKKILEFFKQIRFIGAPSDIIIEAEDSVGFVDEFEVVFLLISEKHRFYGDMYKGIELRRTGVQHATCIAERVDLNMPIVIIR